MECGIGLLTNVPYHHLSRAFLSFFFFRRPPTARRPPSFPVPPRPPFPVSRLFPPCPPLSSNKAAISNWNSMLSRSAHLIYKIKLKASHARMAFCSDEGKEEGKPFSCTQSSSRHVICQFLAVTPSSCHLL